MFLHVAVLAFFVQPEPGPVTMSFGRSTRPLGGRFDRPSPVGI